MYSGSPAIRAIKSQTPLEAAGEQGRPRRATSNRGATRDGLGVKKECRDDEDSRRMKLERFSELEERLGAKRTMSNCVYFGCHLCIVNIHK